MTATVCYNKETTKLFRSESGITVFLNSATCRAAFTRATKAGKVLAPEEWAFADYHVFKQSIEKKEIRRGIVGAEGKEFTVGVNEPWTSGPWSETYWSS